MRHRACRCGVGHIKEYHGPKHTHAPYVEECPDQCCIVGACPCREYRGTLQPGKLIRERK